MRYFVEKNGNPKGPYTKSELMELRRMGEISPFDRFRSEDSDTWLEGINLVRALDRDMAEHAPIPGPSSGNVVAGIASFFVPGLGQLVQGRVLDALFYFLTSILLWLILLGWVIHLVSAYSAAVYSPTK